MCLLQECFEHRFDKNAGLFRSEQERGRNIPELWSWLMGRSLGKRFLGCSCCRRIEVRGWTRKVRVLCQSTESWAPGRPNAFCSIVTCECKHNRIQSQAANRHQSTKPSPDQLHQEAGPGHRAWKCSSRRWARPSTGQGVGLRTRSLFPGAGGPGQRKQIKPN